MMEFGPRYWREEITGCLAKPIRKFLNGFTLDDGEIALIRAYLEQWVDAPVWDMNPHADPEGRRELAALRQEAREIATRADIGRWMYKAMQMGMDPL
jgi:hypothetical protein